jgi:queuine tRNA-ribosyltransferase
MASDFNVIDSTCPCATCLEGNGLSRASLWNMVGKETAAASAVTIHNLTYQVRRFTKNLFSLSRFRNSQTITGWLQSRLMDGARTAVLEDRFPQYLIDFFDGYFVEKDKFP